MDSVSVLHREPPRCIRGRFGRASPDSQRQRQAEKNAETRRAAEWVASQFKNMGLKAGGNSHQGPPARLRRNARRPRQAGRPLSTATTTSSPPTRSTNGSAPRSNRPSAMATSTPAARPTTKAKCSRTSKASKPGSSPAATLPLQVKFLIEGEEEVGSQNLEPFVEQNRDKLACDCVVISDCSQFAPGIPAITYGLRGIAYYELKLRGPKQDLHSGTFGGAVTNPAERPRHAPRRPQRQRRPHPSPRLLRRRRNPSPIASATSTASSPSPKPSSCNPSASTACSARPATQPIERRWARPTCDINGLTSGYQGEGAKTVLPAKASAKFSFRLVPNQDPAKITKSPSQVFGRAPPTRHPDGARRSPRRTRRHGLARKPLHARRRRRDRIRLRPRARS